MKRTEANRILLGDYFTAEQLEKMSNQKICAIAKKVAKQEEENNVNNWTKENWL